jgi:hypothetical protein
LKKLSFSLGSFSYSLWKLIFGEFLLLLNNFILLCGEHTLFSKVTYLGLTFSFLFPKEVASQRHITLKIHLYVIYIELLLLLLFHPF